MKRINRRKDPFTMLMCEIALSCDKTPAFNQSTSDKREGNGLDLILVFMYACVLIPFREIS